jgi:hypothetical protein
MADPSLESASDLRMNGREMPGKIAGDDAPHGRAALLLVESLIHALVEKSVITHGEAIDIIDIAADVEAELAGVDPDGGGAEALLLAPLARTIRNEMRD